jgi:PQQ-dependent dehydrogenase (methanol/ethanol family)
MSIRTFVVAALVACLLSSTGAQSVAQSEAGPKTDWPLGHGNIRNDRYSALNEINKQTVSKLGAAWVSEPYDDGANSRATPVVQDGIMYIAAGAKVYALEAVTGRRVWVQDTAEFKSAVAVAGSPDTLGKGVPSSQALGAGEGKIFVSMSDARLIALDQKSGKLLWATYLGQTDRVAQEATPAAPVYSNGVVFTSAQWGYERYSGRAYALNAQTGEVIWKWDSIPKPGEPGRETWAQEGKWAHISTNAGGSIWLPPAVDPELGLVYYGTGNPTPNRIGIARPGDNLYTGTIVALDIKTGKLRWYFQIVHHDLWEGDVATPVMAFDRVIDGKPQKLLAALRADGTLFVLDRTSGKPAVPVEERPVRQDLRWATSPTQPYPVGHGSVIVPDCARWEDKISNFQVICEAFAPPFTDVPNVLTPGPFTRYQPMAFNPQTGLVYVQGNDRMQWEWSSLDPWSGEYGDFYLIARIPRVLAPAVTIFAAVDPITYRVVWKKEMPLSVEAFGNGGWMTTAGGLAFHRRDTGELVAFDAADGSELWTFQTGLHGGQASPMTYEVHGEQYIAMASGREVWAFKLDGKVPERPAPAPPATQMGLLGPVSESGLMGPVVDTQQIHATSLNEFNYRYAITPLKARVKAGVTVEFINDSAEPHTFEAVDGFWTTRELQPRENALLKFDRPGTYLYHFKEQPWSYAEITVIAADKDNAAAPAAAPSAASGLMAQLRRGEMVYEKSCATCHQENLAGKDVNPPLIGAGFVSKYRGQPMQGLVDRTRTTMPLSAPRSLSDQAYRDVVAYILKANNLPLSADGVTPETSKGVLP